MHVNREKSAVLRKEDGKGKDAQQLRINRTRASAGKRGRGRVKKKGEPMKQPGKKKETDGKRKTQTPSRSRKKKLADLGGGPIPPEKTARPGKKKNPNEPVGDSFRARGTGQKTIEKGTSSDHCTGRQGVGVTQ